MPEGDFYEKPKHGWTCFHCGETFTTTGAARDHFGVDQSATPGCQIKVGHERGLLMALRKAEAELARYRAEDAEPLRSMYAAMVTAQHRHSDALRDAEETGYARGLADGLAASERQRSRT